MYLVPNPQISVRYDWRDNLEHFIDDFGSFREQALYPHPRLILYLLPQVYLFWKFLQQHGRPIVFPCLRKRGDWEVESMAY